MFSGLYADFKAVWVTFLLSLQSDLTCTGGWQHSRIPTASTMIKKKSYMKTGVSVCAYLSYYTREQHDMLVLAFDFNHVHFCLQITFFVITWVSLCFRLPSGAVCAAVCGKPSWWIKSGTHGDHQCRAENQRRCVTLYLLFFRSTSDMLKCVPTLFLFIHLTSSFLP